MSKFDGGLPPAQQMYLSTHNALRADLGQHEKFSVTLHEVKSFRHVNLSIFAFYDVQMVKRLLIKSLRLPTETSIKDIRLLYKGTELPNYRALSDFAVGKKLFYEVREDGSDFSIRAVGFRLSSSFERVIKNTKLAFRRSIAPRLTLEGTGGTYMLLNCVKKVMAIFKPSDEEAFAPFNPRGYAGKMNQQGFRAGVLSGEGASREIAAFYLDALYAGHIGVPETTLVEARHPSFNYSQSAQAILPTSQHEIGWKTGSLQDFVEETESCGNYDCRQFSVRDVHHVGLFDIRVMNLDRNDGNILVKSLIFPPASLLRSNSVEGTLPANQEFVHRHLTIENTIARYYLIPIDHGLILPDVMDVSTLDLVWLDWPQTKIPFSKETVELIMSFEADKDADRLRRKLLIRDECLRTMRVATRLLQIGTSMRLTLFQIASILCRDNFDTPSSLEVLVKDAIRQVYQTLDSASLISTNRLGYAGDLAEGALDPISRRNRMGELGFVCFDLKVREMGAVEEELSHDGDLSKGLCGSQRSKSNALQVEGSCEKIAENSIAEKKGEKNHKILSQNPTTVKSSDEGMWLDESSSLSSNELSSDQDDSSDEPSGQPVSIPSKLDSADEALKRISSLRTISLNTDLPCKTASQQENSLEKIPPRKIPTQNIQKKRVCWRCGRHNNKTEHPNDKSPPSFALQTSCAPDISSKAHNSPENTQKNHDKNQIKSTENRDDNQIKNTENQHKKQIKKKQNLNQMKNTENQDKNQIKNTQNQDKNKNPQDKNSTIKLQTNNLTQDDVEEDDSGYESDVDIVRTNKLHSEDDDTGRSQIVSTNFRTVPDQMGGNWDENGKKKREKDEKKDEKNEKNDEKTEKNRRKNEQAAAKQETELQKTDKYLPSPAFFAYPKKKNQKKMPSMRKIHANFPLPPPTETLLPRRPFPHQPTRHHAQEHSEYDISRHRIQETTGSGCKFDMGYPRLIWSGCSNRLGG